MEAADPEWRRLLAQWPASPFQHPDWGRAWLRHLAPGSEPWLLLAGNPPALLLPLVLRRRAGCRILELFGHGVSDYLGLVGDSSQPELIRAIAERLRLENRGFDLLHLKGLGSTDSANAIGELLLGPTAERPYEPCPFVDTSGDWESYLATRGRSLRSNLKGAKRRLEKQGELAVRNKAASKESFDQILELERHSWKWDNGSSFVFNRSRLAFLRHVLLEARIPNELWIATCSGLPISYAVILVSGGTRYYYLPSYRSDHPGAGNYLLEAAVRDSFDSSCLTFDLLQGNEPYKAAWATGERWVHEFAAAQTLARGRLALAGLRARWYMARSQRLHELRDRALRVARRVRGG